MDSFSKCVFVRAGKHTSVHDMHPHSNEQHLTKSKAELCHIDYVACLLTCFNQFNTHFFYYSILFCLSVYILSKSSAKY